ncbi:MAG: hypothetical protein QXF74_05125 [Nitrososphaerota archaeon]
MSKNGFYFNGVYRLLNPFGSTLKVGFFSILGGQEIGAYEYRVISSQPIPCSINVKVFVENVQVAEHNEADVHGILTPDNFLILNEGIVKNVNFTYIVKWKTLDKEWTATSYHTLPLVRFGNKIYYFSGVSEGEYSKVNALTTITVFGLSISPAIVISLSVFFAGLPSLGRGKR